jgi:spectinomycin phosphotransferase
MREPPIDLPDSTLEAYLRIHYGLGVSEIAFLPLGHDSSAWVYRVETNDDAPYFLKVRTSVTNAPGLLVPRYLHEHGVAPVIAPLPTVEGTSWAAVDGYALILYPFVAGTTGMEHGMAPAQWIAYGASLRQIHATTLPPDLALLMPRETFVPAGVAEIHEVEAYIAAGSATDPEARALAVFWQQQREKIRTLVTRAEDLGQRLAQTASPLVLCHADIHTANVLLDTQGQIWIVDWDETMLAPKERDLMFVVGGGISRRLVGPADENLFLQGYGSTSIDARGLTYYRYAWAVSDIGAYAAEVLFRPDLGEITRRAAVELFMSLFQPGNIVALALASDDR